MTMLLAPEDAVALAEALELAEAEQLALPRERPGGPSPEDKRHLAEAAYRLTGLRVPDRAICPGHTAPLDALAEAYFGTYPVTIWKASRGLGGKTTLLALLAHLETVFLGAEVSILGGSGQQARRVHEEQSRFWQHDNAPVSLLASEPTQYQTQLTNGGSTVALMASTRSARGPHPQRLRLDEVDEMDLKVLDAATGQPMSARGIQSQTVLSSTHQYADGVMTEVLKRAADRGYPVRSWCWRENLEPHGWLSEETKERKRSEVTVSMWNVEYEMGEPSPESRAIDTEMVEAMFKAMIGEYGGALGEDVIAESPVDGATYSHGSDWARDKDFTILWTFRTDVRPLRLVAFRRDGRRPYPLMVEKLDERVKRYPGPVAHDATGLGTVIDDLLTVEAEGVTLVGKTRSTILSDYIKAIEANEVVAPYISYAYSEHKLATLNDLYGSGHLPDTICAGALAYRAHRYPKSQVPYVF